MKVQTSEEKLVRYQKDHSILGVDEKQNIVTAKLDELNKELTAAQTDRIEKESNYRLAMDGDPDAFTKVSPEGDEQSCSTSCVKKKLTSRPNTHRQQPSLVPAIQRSPN